MKKPEEKPFFRFFIFCTFENTKSAALKKFIFLALLFAFFSCTQTTGYHPLNLDSKIDSLYYTFKNPNLDPVEKEKKLDSITFLLEKSNYSDKIREHYSDVISGYGMIGNKNKQRKVSKFFETRSSRANDEEGTVQALCFLGMEYFSAFKADSAYYYYLKAEKISQKLKENPFLSNILLNKSNILCVQHNFSTAQTNAVKALKIAKQKGYSDLIYGSYIAIGNALYGMNEYEESKSYYQLALNETEHLKANELYLDFKTQAQNYIGLVYQKQGKFQDVLNYYKNSINLEELQKQNVSTYPYILKNLAYAKFKLKEPGAMALFDEALSIGKTNRNDALTVTVYSAMGELTLDEKEYTQANLYLNQALDLARKAKFTEDELFILKLLTQSKPVNSNVIQDYITLNDSVIKQERKAEEKFSRIEFETDQILYQKRLAEEEINTLKNRIWVIIGFGLSILLTILLWVINDSRRAKTRELKLIKEQQQANEEIYKLVLDQNQKLEEGKQMEKKRISLDLHDGVMGRLSSIRMNLFILNKKNDPETIAKCLEYVKDIQNIEKEIRAISHDLSNNHFSGKVNFITIVENLFTAVKNHSDIDFQAKFDDRIEWEVVSSAVKINIYRIIQEALQNIDKYANAKTVVVEMQKGEGVIHVIIQDDGQGFDTEKKPDGIGLKNMRLRVSEINGDFHIESKPGNGTKINLNIPI